MRFYHKSNERAAETNPFLLPFQPPTKGAPGSASNVRTTSERYPFHACAGSTSLSPHLDLFHLHSSQLTPAQFACLRISKTLNSIISTLEAWDPRSCPKSGKFGSCHGLRLLGAALCKPMCGTIPWLIVSNLLADLLPRTCCKTLVTRHRQW